MMRRMIRVLVVLAITASTASAQSDLDSLMQRVLAKRDENWRKLQQYVLDERETLQVTGPGGGRVFGFRREYLWFPRDGRFIRSPLAADGVRIGEEERRRAEAQWLAREERRERRRVEGAGATEENQGEIGIGPAGVNVQFKSAMSEPGFISAAYFLNFRFEGGQYALVGREKHHGRDVLRIEYYPTQMFKEGRTRPNRELRRRDEDVERKMNKVSLVTLWVDPAEAQIVKYDFRNIDADFLPARWLLRLDGLTAAMEMGQPFPGVWLPRSIQIGINFALATGEADAQYSSEFYDYRLASVDTRVRP